MRLVCVFIALLFAHIPASASDWIRIGQTKAGSIGYLDIDSMGYSPDRPSAWVKWDSSRDPTDKARESKELYQARCSTRQLRLVKWIAYDARGSAIGSGPAYASDLDFEPITPDSMGETIFEALCPPKSINGD